MNGEFTTAAKVHGNQLPGRRIPRQRPPCLPIAFVTSTSRNDQAVSSPDFLLRRYGWLRHCLEQKTLQTLDNPSQGCHPCLRYVPLPMSQGRTRCSWRRERNWVPTFSRRFSRAFAPLRRFQPLWVTRQPCPPWARSGHTISHNGFNAQPRLRPGLVSPLHECR